LPFLSFYFCLLPYLTPPLISLRIALNGAQMKRKIILFFLLIPILVMAAENIRPFLTTGPWYPADAQKLRKMLEGFFAQASVPEKTGAVIGIIAPHAGFAYSGLCAASAYRALSPAQGIRRVILLGSSHRSGFYGACVSDYAAYVTPLGTVPVDAAICQALAAKKLFRSDRDTMRYEHALENQLPFLQQALGESPYKIVPIIFGALGKKDFSAMTEAIAPFIDDRTLVVASSDLTHYGEGFSYTPFTGDLRKKLTALDQGFIRTIGDLDFEKYWRYHEKTGITACGFVPMGLMIKLFAGKGIGVSLADYYKSGDVNNDYQTSVSYASLLFSAKGGPPAGPIGLSAREQTLLLELARSSLRSYFENIRMPQQKENQFSAYPKLAENLGVFVTLREKGELRGCIGSISGAEPLYRGVMAKAVQSAVGDPRFPPLQQKELESVEIEISVMTPLRLVSDYHSIRLGIDGVVIREDRAQAVFLPQVAAETGWTLEQFLGSLCVKAGLQRDGFRLSRTMEFYVFQAQVFSEKDRQK
jgi:AmmeMemoRadiSam system protein B/AmmeMemoRadiSam system protein A